MIKLKGRPIATASSQIHKVDTGGSARCSGLPSSLSVCLQLNLDVPLTLKAAVLSTGLDDSGQYRE